MSIIFVFFVTRNYELFIKAQVIKAVVVGVVLLMILLGKKKQTC